MGDVPRHVAIIMDGNGRWAERHDLSRAEGHRAGARAVERLMDDSRELAVEYLTLYAFSTENWKRSIGEVSALMSLLAEFCDSRAEKMMRNQVRLRVIGRTADLPYPVRRKLEKTIELTAANTGVTLTLALSYGGRAELADAAKKLACEVASGALNPEDIDEQKLASALYAPDLPDPDLLIRTSGELRLSNFLLWQLAYAEIYVTDVLWPDFDRAEFDRAVAAYNKRERRFGGRKEK